MTGKIKRDNIRFRYVLCIVVILIVVFLLIGKEQRRIHILEPYRIMPSICALDMFGDSVNCNSILNPEKKTAILFFSPECEACKKEINDIIVFHNEFRSIQWVFITIAQYEELECFLKQYPIQSLTDAILLREDYPKNHIVFDVSAPPALYIYNEKGKLVAMYKGEILLPSIIKDL